LYARHLRDFSATEIRSRLAHLVTLAMLSVALAIAICVVGWPQPSAICALGSAVGLVVLVPPYVLGLRAVAGDIESRRISRWSNRLPQTRLL
jgi:Flp pilus assembly protein TadB